MTVAKEINLEDILIPGKAASDELMRSLTEIQANNPALKKLNLMNIADLGNDNLSDAAKAQFEALEAMGLQITGQYN